MSDVDWDSNCGLLRAKDVFWYLLPSINSLPRLFIDIHCPNTSNMTSVLRKSPSFKKKKKKKDQT